MCERVDGNGSKLRLIPHSCQGEQGDGGKGKGKGTHECRLPGDQEVWEEVNVPHVEGKRWDGSRLHSIETRRGVGGVQISIIDSLDFSTMASRGRPKITLLSSQTVQSATEYPPIYNHTYLHIIPPPQHIILCMRSRKSQANIQPVPD